ncbi:Hypothetical predicted protein [Paramuricea clavata]|uniref:Uncharacterized protein n=1 Tax=Paramuricea clavata TaxID=317549 RepID=A0A6S7GIZ4_PARCT|nr:Hypothetical predicted protein [Paramuricea clavata]
MLIVGMTGSGKTQFLLNMLETEYNRVFDYIVIICPTIEWNMTYINWTHISDHGVIQIPCSQEMIDLVLKAVSTIFRGTQTLIIVDDCAASQDVKKRVSELVRLAFSARHYNLSVIVLTQQLSSVAKPFRENISRLVTFYNPSRRDMKVITDDYLSGVPQETITEITKILKDEKFTATDMMGTESEEEIFEAVREVEEAAKVPQKKAKSTARKTKSTADKSQTKSKRDKLIELSRDAIIEKPASFIRKSNKDVVDRLYHEYESQRMSCASDFLSTLIISKFASVLGSFGAVESSEKLSEELLSDKLLKDDVAYLTRTISPNIPFIGLISGGCTTAKHVVAHKWNKKEEPEEVSEETKHLLLHTECHDSEGPPTGEIPGKE